MTKAKSLKTKLVAVHEEHVEEALSAQRETSQVIARDSLLIVLGGIRAVHSVSEALSAQSIRALQRIRDEELYKAEGFTRFDTFLDESPLSPMSYDKFNRLEKALLSEGDELFNYLNSINAPMATRRLLGKGTLAVEGEEIVIRQDNGEQRIAVTDRAILLTTLSKLADQNAEQRRTIERQSKKLKKGEEEYEKLKRQPPTSDTIISRGFDDCLFAAVSAIGALKDRVSELTSAEAEAARARVLELVGNPFQELQKAFLAHEGKQTKRGARASSLTANVTAADVESLMET